MNSDSRVIVALNMLGIDGANESTLNKHLKAVDALDTLMTGGPGRARKIGLHPDIELPDNPAIAKYGILLADRLIGLDAETGTDAVRIGIAFACGASVGMQYAEHEASDVADAVRSAYGRDPSLDEFQEAIGAIGIGIADDALASDPGRLGTLASAVRTLLGEGLGDYAAVRALEALVSPN